MKSRVQIQFVVDTGCSPDQASFNPTTTRVRCQRSPTHIMWEGTTMPLPAEIWARIFDLAADDDILFRPGIPTTLAESAWCKDDRKTYLTRGNPEWALRSPEQAMDVLQRRSYSTKKVISSLFCRLFSLLTPTNARQSSPHVGSGDRLVLNPSSGVYISAMPQTLSHYVRCWTRLLRSLLLQRLHMAGGRKGYILVPTSTQDMVLHQSRNIKIM